MGVATALVYGLMQLWLVWGILGFITFRFGGVN